MNQPTEILTIFNIINFLAKHKLPIIVCGLIGLAAGMFLGKNKSEYETIIIIERPIEEISVLRNPEKVNKAIATIFAQSTFSKSFSEKFYDLLAKDKNGNEAIDFYLKSFSQGIMKKNTPQREMFVFGLSAHLSRKMAAIQKKPKTIKSTGFLFLIRAEDSDSWRFQFRFNRPGVAAATVKAAIFAFNAIITKYNKLMSEIGKKTYDNISRKAGAHFELEGERFLASKEIFDKQWAEIRTRLHILDDNLRKYERIESEVGRSTIKVVETLVPVILIDSFQRAQNIDAIRSLEFSRIFRRIALLQANSNSSTGKLAKIKNELDILEQKAAAIAGKMEGPAKSFEVAKNNLSQRLTTAYTWLEENEKELGSARQDLGTLNTQLSADRIDVEKTKKITMYKIIGILIGCLVGAILGVATSFYNKVRENENNSKIKQRNSLA